MRRVLKSILMIGGLFAATYLPSVYMQSAGSGPAQCFGTAANGHVSGARQIKPSPARVYCWACQQALRTFAHAPVAQAVEAAYNDMAEHFPETDWVLGEVGWPWGGRIAPHKTHRNGTSVDFMVPLENGKSFPSSAWNRFGYDLAFDAKGQGDAGQINFEAVGAHLMALEARSRENGGRIRRVILAPDLQDNLPAGLRRKFAFNAAPSWVRHDDHYHVDFDYSCGPV